MLRLHGKQVMLEKRPLPHCDDTNSAVNVPVNCALLAHCQIGAISTFE